MSTTRLARIGFSLVAWLFAVGTVILVYLAGTAIPRLGGSEANFEMHRNFGYIFGILTVVLIVLALAGRMPRKVVLATLVLLGLMAMQSVFVFVRTDQPTVAALHPVNGFLIVLVAVWVAWGTLRYLRAPLPVDAEAEAIARRQAELAAATPMPPPPDETD
jgi:hypothetical protein